MTKKRTTSRAQRKHNRQSRSDKDIREVGRLMYEYCRHTLGLTEREASQCRRIAIAAQA